MLRAFIFLTIVSLHANAQVPGNFGTDSSARFFDSVVCVLKNRSLFKDKVNWRVYEDTIRHLLSVKAGKERILKVIGSIYTDMGDYHGCLYYNGVRYGMRQGQVDVRSELRDGFRQGAIIRSSVVKKKYGYIFIPAIKALNEDLANFYANKIDSAICSISPNVRGWIIDLRMNLGGNMYPMICGLRSLLGDGNCGAFVDVNLDTIKWIVSKGTFRAGAESASVANPGCNFESLPVAVLISPLTSSSGEATAIALRGRSKTTFIGEPTSGYITSLERYHFDNRSMLLVSEGYMLDRNGVAYKNRVVPNYIMVGGDNFSDLEKDAKIKEAMSWLSDF